MRIGLKVSNIMRGCCRSYFSVHLCDMATLSFSFLTVSLEARDLVERMLERDPKKRISAKEALEHPWIVTRAPRTVLTDGSKSLAEEATACIIS